MSTDDFGNGISRTLDADSRQFQHVVWQKGKPPLDSELNLISQVQEEARRRLIRSGVPSGWLGDPTRPSRDLSFDPQASNVFWMGEDSADGRGVPHAIVNGWVIPVAGTLSADLRNEIRLPPPYTSVSSADANFVFLEVWKSRISPDNDTNKPAVDKVYKYGNVDWGGTQLDDDMVDKEIGFETSNRIQLQYRLRVADGVDPSAFPDGFNPSIKVQGPNDSEVSSTNPAYQYENMAQQMGDSGLWRAGTGNPDSSLTDTVDGYVWAVPLCLVFRRTDSSWSVVNQHGAFNRNPDMTDRSEAKVLPTVTTAQELLPGSTVLEVDTSRVSTTFEQTPTTGRDLLRVGDEVVRYSDWTGTTITLSERGARNTHETKHTVGTEVNWASDHPEGLYSDQIVRDDVLDIRHMVNLGEFDHQAMLERNFQKLISGELRTHWKRSEGNVKGTRTWQVDFLSNATPPPNGTIPLDSPDGFRRIYSDACALQPDNLVSLAADQDTVDASDYTLNPSVASVWRSVDNQWSAGDVVRMTVDQFRSTFSTADDERVRFVHPFEYDGASHDSLKVWFGDTNPGSAGAHLSGRHSVSEEGSVDEPDFSGQHDGSSNSADLVDSTASFPTDGSLEGATVVNQTDGSFGYVDQVIDANTITLTGLSGGTDNDFDAGDSYTVALEPFFVALGKKPAGNLPVPIEGSSSTVHFDDGGSDFIEIDGVDFSQTYEGMPVGDWLASEDVWIVVGNAPGNTTGNPANHGAFRIVGASGTGLIVSTARGLSPRFVTSTGDSREWALRVPKCTKADDEIFIALNRPEKTGGVLSAEQAFVSFDVLYDPAQGLGRVPEETLYCQLETASTGVYLRENDFSNFVNSPGATVKKYSALPFGMYPHQRDAFAPGPSQSLGKERHVVSGESYVDAGSKTLLMQPWRRVDADFQAVSLGATASYSDPTNTFGLTAGDDSYLMPSAVVPKPGRIDVPFTTEQSTNQEDPPFGFNFLLHAGVDTGPNTDVISNGNGNGFFVVYDPEEFDDADFGSWVDLGAHGGPSGVNALVTRPYQVQDQIVGIELPAHFGIARLYGAWAFDDFDAQGGQSGFSGTTLRTDAGIYENYLRTDGAPGALLVTTDNTFVIGTNALDTNQIDLGSHDPQQNCVVAADPMVFELETFMFEDMTDPEFVRLHTLNGATIQNRLKTYVNGPVETGDSLYVVSTRTPYQGNVTQTMPGSATDTALLTPDDYVLKHGQETQSEIVSDLGELLDADAVRTPNATQLEVVASLPFATTIGTGALTGPVVSGSYTDVGYLSLEGYPYTNTTDPDRDSMVRAAPTAPDGTPLMRPLSDALAGLSERLPMGIALGDYQMLAEQIGEQGVRLWTPSLSVDSPDAFFGDRPQVVSPLEGELVFNDGTSLGELSPRSGFQAQYDLYRTYRGGVCRGGDSADHVVVTGDRVSKILEFLDNPDARDRKFHGAVLFGAALLVRDTPTEVTDNAYHFSGGGELQMLVLTAVVPGGEQIPSGYAREVLDLMLEMHPRGIGEGWAAADRYRIEGRPLGPSGPIESAGDTDNDEWLYG